ncbi:MAG: hypothetical protein ACREOW_12475 [Thermodesulfobacteriota bacterium]
MKRIKAFAVHVLGITEMRGSMGLLTLFLMAMAGLTLGVTTPAAWAAEFSEAELFFELNDTDGDLGIHASIDGGPYTRLGIDDPKGRTILLTTASGRLAKQGLTQYFLESAEPPFDELPPEVFFSRFPEGEYEIEGRSLKGEEFGATVELSHVLAAPVDNIKVNGDDAAENCDSDPLPVVDANEPVTINWDPVEESHPEIGESGEVDIVRYQFFVEQGDLKFSVDLPPSVTVFEVPLSITALGGTFKFEIIARTATGNNTAIENCFIVEQP